MSVNDPIVTEAPAVPASATRFSLEEIKKKFEEVKAALESTSAPIVIEEPPVAIPTVPAEVTRFTVEDVKRRFEEMEATPEEGEDFEGDANLLIALSLCRELS